MKVRIINKTKASKKIDRALRTLQENVENEVKESTERIVENIYWNNALVP